MNIHFNVEGADRKALVAAISKATGTTSKYMGAPSFSYGIGGYTITKDGTLECGDAQAQEVSALLESLAEGGFLPAKMPDLSGVSEAETVTSGAELEGVFAIDLPSEGMDDLAAENLRKLVAGKAPLIRAALGDDLADEALPVVLEDGRVCLPWFQPGMDADAIAAWSFFAVALCATAKKQKRVVMSEKPYDGSEKYAMRCFLLKLGFIGEEYKPARKILLANLSGNGSHKNPKEDAPAPAPADDMLDTEHELAETLADAELIHGVNASFLHDDTDEGDRLVRGGLCCVPHSDVNYASYLRRATDTQLGEAIAHMELVPDGNKGRIAACRRELAKRENATANDYSGITVAASEEEAE